VTYGSFRYGLEDGHTRRFEGFPASGATRGRSSGRTPGHAETALTRWPDEPVKGGKREDL